MTLKEIGKIPPCVSEARISQVHTEAISILKSLMHPEFEEISKADKIIPYLYKNTPLRWGSDLVHIANQYGYNYGTFYDLQLITGKNNLKLHELQREGFFETINLKEGKTKFFVKDINKAVDSIKNISKLIN